MTGTVAVGNALIGSTVTVMDSTGKTVTATSDSNGAYTIALAGLTPPLLITAVDASGANSTLYSLVASTTTSGATSITANVTPLTTAVAAELTNSGNPGDLASTSALSSVSPAAVTAAVTQINTALAPILAKNGLSAVTFDPIGGAFTPNQTGADAVIDSIVVAPSATGTGLQLSSLADSTTAIQLKNNGGNFPTLQPPAQSANYLAALVQSLGQCVAGTTASCTSAIDPNYLNDGYMTMQARHGGLFASGSKLIGAKTIAFLPASTFSAITNAGALVYFLYVSANGTPNFASEFVQQLPNGTWDIIGNQEQYDVYIASFLARKQFTDAADANNGRLESGIDIQIPQAVNVHGTWTSVGSALVQGPGINGNGLYMLNTAQGLGNANFGLTIPSVALTSPWTGCGTCAQSNGTSSSYKWDWVSLSGGTSSFSPNGLADYTPQPISVASLPQHAIYTVTLFGTTGIQIGQPLQVMNIAPNVAAAAAAIVPWQTLGSDVIANFLAPNGSEATAAQSTVPLDWTAPSLMASSAKPNFGVSIGAVTAATQTSPQEAYYSNDYVTVPASAGTDAFAETFNSGRSATTEGLSAEVSRYVKLGWQADGVYYSNIWVYN
ncbi:cell wall anchor protein [Trinickia dinghuensis]|uniref:Cell wall anchor protein n=2 Tax=Trinickia dinghuensis TaxID=2291023 RepID=A0A3D8JPH0_9BURK|nr:cell wall anchor protein [Trinickia dinghuensis]